MFQQNWSKRKKTKSLVLEQVFIFFKYFTYIIVIILKSKIVEDPDKTVIPKIDAKLKFLKNLKTELLIKSKNYTEAFKRLNDAIKIDPNDSASYKLRGDAYFQLKNYDEAIGDYKKAIENSILKRSLYKSLYNAYFEKGNISRNAKKWSEALQSFHEADNLKQSFYF